MTIMDRPIGNFPKYRKDAGPLRVPREERPEWLRELACLRCGQQDLEQVRMRYGDDRFVCRSCHQWHVPEGGNPG